MLREPRITDGRARVSKQNARRSNGHRRTQLLAWLRELGTPCWICGHPIDTGLPSGDPMSLECDELVPVSLGGSPLDRSNVARAHRCCNNWRRAKPVGRVRDIQAIVTSSFGGSTSPVDFVAKAKAVERCPDAGTGKTPPLTTTEW